MSTLAELALEAADLIEAAPVSAWTKDAYARDEERGSTGIRSKTAVCWCAVGFLGRTRDFYYTPEHEVDLLIQANDSAANRDEAIANLRALAAAQSEQTA